MISVLQNKSKDAYTVSEADLIKEVQNDTSKFELLYKKYFEQIFLFALKRVESEDIAADIASQVFLKALSNISKYKDMGFPFSSWLYRICRNEIYDLHKKNKIQLVLSIETTGISKMVSEIGEKSKEDYEDLHKALEYLDDDEVELIELRFFEQRPFKEIGEILEITENNAKVKTYRILDKLKNTMSNGKQI